MSPAETGFKRRLLNRDLLAGAFIKTPAPHGVEIAGLAGLDFVVVDAEHAPITCDVLDRCVVAGRAVGLPVLARVPAADSPMIQQALDLGAVGVMVPHVSSAAEARALVERTRLRAGRRGYSNSVRAGDFGRMGLEAFVAHGDAEAVVVAQIEDPQGLAEAQGIAAQSGVDALFVGRADLAVALGVASLDDPTVMQAVADIARAARGAGKTCGTFAADTSGMRTQVELGLSLFVIGSDQSAMQSVWKRNAGEAAALRTTFPRSDTAD